MTNDLLRASALYRDTHCLANRRLTKEAEQMGILPPAWTEFTERGTRVHAGNPDNQDERDAHEFCHAQMFRSLQELNGPDPGTCEITIEQRLYLRDGLVPYFTGQSDIVFHYPGRIIFGDYKPGFEADWEAWEAQMGGYACLLYENLWHSGIYEITGIISTRFYGTQLYTYELDKLPEAIEAIKAATEVDSNKALPFPGPWCRYCKARLICKEALSQPLATYYQPIEQLPAGLDGALVVDKLKLIVKIANDRLAYYKSKMISDPSFLGGAWELSTRKTRSVIDTKAAAQALAQSKLLDRDRIMECMKLSLPEAQAAIRETNAGMTVKAAKDALVEILGSLLVVQESEPFLVKAKEPKEIE